jgi:hypothetical protein
VSHLPPSWGTLYAMTKIPEPELEALLASGTINCETERKTVEEIIEKIVKEGLYRSERVAQALNVLFSFMKKWPDPTDLPSDVFNYMDESEHAIDIDHLPKLVSWIDKLHTICKSAEQRLDTSRDNVE